MKYIVIYHDYDSGDLRKEVFNHQSDAREFLAASDSKAYLVIAEGDPIIEDHT